MTKYVANVHADWVEVDGEQIYLWFLDIEKSEHLQKIIEELQALEPEIEVDETYVRGLIAKHRLYEKFGDKFGEFVQDVGELIKLDIKK